MAIAASNCAPSADDVEAATEQTDQLFYKLFCKLLNRFWITQYIKSK